MKAIAILVLAFAAGAMCVSAQGFLAANNQNTTPITFSDYFGGTSNVVGTPGCPLGQGSLIVTLWIATNGAPSSALIEVARGTNSTSGLPAAAGTFNLGNPLVLPSPWDGSFEVELLYRVWTWSSGVTNWPTASYFGPGGYCYPAQSALLSNFKLGVGIQPPPPTFGPGLLQGIQINLIPEPSTWSFWGLSLVGLSTLRLLQRVSQRRTTSPRE
jgi:hypothetical protein